MTVDTYFGKELMTMTSLYSYYVYAGEWQNVTAKIKGASKYKQKVGDLTPQQMTWQYDSDPGDTSSMQSIRRFEGFAQSFSFEGKAYRSVTFLANEQMAHYDNGKEIYQKAYEARYRYAHNLGIVQFDYLREGDQKGTYYLDKIIPDSLIQQEYDEEHAN